MYDEKQIAEFVRQKRARFWRALLFVLVPMVVFLLLIVLRLDDTLTAISWITLFTLAIVLYRIWGRYKPTVLFSKEVRGENIKEVEYIGVRQTNSAGKYRPHGSQIRPPRPTGRPKPRLDSAVRSTVYLKTGDTNVTFITDLYKSATDIYEIGDLLVKYAGAKYPVICSRTPQRQPCPLCGTVNDMTADKCRECGLKIARSSSE